MIALNFGIRGHIADVITHAKFCDNPFRVFGVLIPPILPFSIGIAGRPYNSVSTTVLHCDSPNRPELNSADYKIWGVYNSMNMSCNSTRLKKSSSDWRNSGKAIIKCLSEKIQFSCFRALPGSAEVLVGEVGRLSRLPFDFLLSSVSWQHSCQKLSKLVDVGR